MGLSSLARLTQAFCPLWLVVATMPSFLQETGAGKYASRRAAPTGTEQAVRDGLVWLARHQNENGSWGAGSFTSHCTPGRPCGSPSTETPSPFDEGLTGLALLTFLARGYTSESKEELADVTAERSFSAGKVVESGVAWLVSRQREDGAFGEPVSGSTLYNDILAALAVIEAYGMSRDGDLKIPAQRAVDHLVRVQSRAAQDSLGGWCYATQGPGAGADRVAQTGGSVSETDLAVTAWAVLALRSAGFSGLSVPEESFTGALAFARRVAEEGRVGLRPPQSAGTAAEVSAHAGTVSAMGMLVRSFAARDASDPFLALAAKKLVEDGRASKGGRPLDLHYWHAATLALCQYEGPGAPNTDRWWHVWWKALGAWLLPLQSRPEPGGTCEGGGWLPDERWGGCTESALYCTALAVLTLETPYRYPRHLR